MAIGDMWPPCCNALVIIIIIIADVGWDCYCCKSGYFYYWLHVMLLGPHM